LSAGGQIALRWVDSNALFANSSSAQTNMPGKAYWRVLVLSHRAPHHRRDWSELPARYIAAALFSRKRGIRPHQAKRQPTGDSNAPRAFLENEAVKFLERRAAPEHHFQKRAIDAPGFPFFRHRGACSLTRNQASRQSSLAPFSRKAGTRKRCAVSMRLHSLANQGGSRFSAPTALVYFFH
jgi:hypothetical protein